jgi:DNA-binding protein Fis
MVSKQNIQTLIDKASLEISSLLSDIAKLKWTIWSQQNQWTLVLEVTEDFNTYNAQKNGADIEKLFEIIIKQIKQEIQNRDDKAIA